MPTSDERIEEFQRIYKQAYGEEISAADARMMALRLVALYQLLMRPLPDDASASPSQEVTQ